MRSFGKGPSPTPPGWAPVGLRYHALHHYFPGIPYHNLGFAYQRLDYKPAGSRWVPGNHEPGPAMVAATFCTLPGKPRYAKDARPRLIHVRRPRATTSISHDAGTIRTRLSAVRKMTIIFSLRGMKYPKKAKNRSSGELSTSPGRGGSTAASSIPPAFSI